MGGVAGHMAHLSEDLDLTFNDIIGVLEKVASGQIKNATEKVDGQNLFLSVDETGEIRTARNKSDIKKGGMTTDEYISKWKGHPAENAFTNGFKAISAALRRLSPEDLSDIFSDGERYVNMEIMYPKNPNIILYSAPQIVLHGLQYFGDDENAVKLQKLANQKFSDLAKAVDGAAEEIGEENWTINGPKIIALQKLADGTAIEQVTQQIESFAGDVGMDATLGDYVRLVVIQYADQLNMPEDVTENLILLMLNPDEAKDAGITVAKLKKGLPKDLQTAISKLGTKTNSRKYISVILRPIELAISDFAIEVLRGVKSFFVDEHDKEIIRMRKELEASIEHLRNLQDSGDAKMGELIDKQLGKLGKIENLASSLEGVVFEYPPGSDKIYKLTGAFAMSNQIIGRARRSGMNESMFRNFTIQISPELKLTKPLCVWFTEAMKSNLKYTSPPQMVYEDILNGTPLTEIVSKDDAEEMIHNTVITYTNKLQEASEGNDHPPWDSAADEWYEDRFVNDQEQWVDVDIEDEDDDPVEDSNFPKKVAIVPGAFKPPHKGHLDMVRKYASMADEVIVLISMPMNNSRTLPNGEPISTDDSLQIWNLLAQDLGNVKIALYNDPTIRSPISAAYALAGAPSEREAASTKVEPSISPIAPGSKIILGASTKGGDAGRWKGAGKYIGGGEDGDLELLDPEQTAVEPTVRSTGEAFSATDFRNALGDPENNRAEIADFVGEENVDGVLEILGLAAVSEAVGSAMGAGAVAGAAVGAKGGPWNSKEIKKDNKRERERSKLVTRTLAIEENNTVDEVMRLIMERGILR